MLALSLTKDFWMMPLHIPVLLDSVLTRLGCQGGVYVDGTFGAGGYTRAILNAHPENRVIAFDRDPTVLPMVEKMKAEFGDRFSFIGDCFSSVADYVKEPVNGFVLDIGVSSMQIDGAERGFSFRLDGPLDMRMSGQGISAADVVNLKGEKELADILYAYGQEKQSRRIAKAIVQNRPFQTTAQLVEVIHSVMPRPKDGSDSAMRSFQALRIYVNDELGELTRALNASIRILKPQGRLVVVSFHSLEDKIVKDFLKENAAPKKHQNKYAKNQETTDKFFIVPEKEIVMADENELQKNSRAHSAKLRWAIRTEVK
jgi:16S rRNA (cytosine1402-N4)-methyltransferase